MEILRHYRSTPEIIFIQWENTLTITCLCPQWLLAAARAERYRCQVYHFSSSFAIVFVAVLTAYWLSHMLVILFWSGSLRSFLTSLPFNRVRLLHLALIFNRADSPLLDWKLVTNTFCISSLTLTDKSNEMFSSHMNSMFANNLVKRKLNKGDKNLDFKFKSIFT